MNDVFAEIVTQDPAGIRTQDLLNTSQMLLPLSHLDSIIIWISPPALVMVTRTAWRTMCCDWVYKSCKVQPGFQFIPVLREWESVEIRLRPLDNAVYVAYLPFPCQESKWLNVKSYIQKVLGSNSSWILNFFFGSTSHPLRKNVFRSVNIFWSQLLQQQT